MMSRNYKKAGRKHNCYNFSKSELYDVTLNDFANSPTVNFSVRLKKNKFPINHMIRKVNQLNLKAGEQSLEAKLNALEALQKQEGNSHLRNDLINNAEVGKLGSRQRKKVIAVDTTDNVSGVDYPIDVWFLISEHIHPEDVGKFAAICKTSLAVVSTAKFWFNLYKRYYKRVPNLPEKLQPKFLVRHYGLRTHVIRALYFMYPPFVAKLKPQVLFEGDPHSLTKRLCVLAWSKKIKNYWIFCFKLKQIGSLDNENNESGKKSKPDLLELLDDITANVDDNCKVLQVTCLNYIILPMLSGHVLNSVSLNIAQGMTYHKLQLNFGSGPLPNSCNNPMILEPVVNVRIFDWWHPLFPHSDGFQY